MIMLSSELAHALWQLVHVTAMSRHIKDGTLTPSESTLLLEFWNQYRDSFGVAQRKGKS